MKNNIKEWLKCAGIRAIKTVAQTAIATIGVSAMLSDVNWLAVGSASLLAGILSLLTSVSGLPEVNDGQVVKSIESVSEEALNQLSKNKEENNEQQ